MPNNRSVAPFVALCLLTMPAVAAGSDNGPLNGPMPQNRIEMVPVPSPVISDMPPATSSASVEQPMGMGAAEMGAPGLTPPGIMMGGAGTWMLGYRYSIDRMDGNLVGGRRISDAAVRVSSWRPPPT